MDDRLRRRAERLAIALAEHGELEPPWARYPWIRNGSIGWRMGTGESYRMLWADFVDAHLPGRDALIAYLRRHPQAPRTWARALASWLARAGDGREDEDADQDEVSDDADRDRALEAAGLIGDDVAYPVFVRNALRDGGMAAPWTFRGVDSPEAALRYSAREVGWWARWIATAGVDRAAWLAAQPVAPPPWASVVAAIGGVAPEAPWTTLTAGAAPLIAAMVAHGAMPPPWLGAHAPKDEIDFNDAPDDRDRWAWWVHDTFEDRASWRTYLDRWPPPPPWRRALDEQLFSWLA